MKAVRGPPGSIKGRQRSRDSQVRYQMYEGEVMGGRSVPSGNISESDLNGNDESFPVFP